MHPSNELRATSRRPGPAEHLHHRARGTGSQRYPSLPRPVTQPVPLHRVERLVDPAEGRSAPTGCGWTSTTTTGPAPGSGSARLHDRLRDADAVHRHRRHDDRRLPGADTDDRRVGPDATRSPRTRCWTTRSGPLGYYGAFIANMHTDAARRSQNDPAAGLGAGAGVPIVSGQQMLTWLDGRNASSFSNVDWSGNTLSFTVGVGAGATGLTGMLPTSRPGRPHARGITAGGARSPFTTDDRQGPAVRRVPGRRRCRQATYTGGGPNRSPPRGPRPTTLATTRSRGRRPTPGRRRCGSAPLPRTWTTRWS